MTSENRKLLSICVPTYNRYSDLLHLYEAFLKYAATFSDVEIIISDNSDQENAISNKSIFPEPIKYYKNDQNLGYAGNFLKCYEYATSDFIWVISDNDNIILDAFSHMLSYLREKSEKIDALFVPYQYENLFFENKVVSARKAKTVNEYFQTGDVPFVLLSSAIIRKNMSPYEAVKIHVGDNIFVQVAMYSLAIVNSKSLDYFCDPVVDYNVEYMGRFDLMRCFRSMESITKFLSQYFPIKIPKIICKELENVVMLLLQCDAGIYRAFQAEKTRQEIVSNSRLLAFASIKVRFLIAMLKLPYLLRKWGGRMYVTFVFKPRTINPIKYYARCKRLQRRIAMTKAIECQTKTMSGEYF